MGSYVLYKEHDPYFRNGDIQFQSRASDYGLMKI